MANPAHCLLESLCPCGCARLAANCWLCQDRTNQHWDRVWSETQMDEPWVGEGGTQLGQCRAKVTQVFFSYRASVSRGFSGPEESSAHSRQHCRPARNHSS